MAKLTKNQKAAAAKIEAGKAYTLDVSALSSCRLQLDDGVDKLLSILADSFS